MTVETIMKRQDEILAMFSKKQRELIIEAIDIEYKLTMVENGYELESIH